MVSDVPVSAEAMTKSDALRFLGLGKQDLHRESSIFTRVNKLFILMFMLVLICELNAYGCVISELYYYNQAKSSITSAQLLIQAALLIGPLSYCVALVKSCGAKEKDNAAETEVQRNTSTAKVAVVLGQAQNQSQQPAQCIHRRLGTMAPAQIHFYHCLPICRWYVVGKAVLKHTAQDDVEVLLKVLALSVSTVGFAHAFCLCVALSEDLLDSSDILFGGVLGSLAMNLLAFVIHFLTPLPGRMKDVTSIEELKAIHRQRLNHQQISVHRASEAERAAFRSKIHEDVKALAKVVQDCSSSHSPHDVDLSMIDLSIFSFAEICLIQICLDMKHFKWCSGVHSASDEGQNI